MGRGNSSRREIIQYEINGLIKNINWSLYADTVEKAHELIKKERIQKAKIIPVYKNIYA
jgi:hypothetical protein